jgi:hypothetical protein
MRNEGSLATFLVANFLPFLPVSAAADDSVAAGSGSSSLRYGINSHLANIVSPRRMHWMVYKYSPSAEKLFEKTETHMCKKTRTYNRNIRDVTYQHPRHSTEGNLALTLMGALAGGNALGITSKQIAVPTQVKFARLQILQVPSFDAVQI